VTINVNLKGLFFLILLVARVMKEQGGGTIINAASLLLLSGVLARALILSDCKVYTR
jgi:NAD(P)-dependent dehydrogenase (short-subunit alcohol dehydrogenase family)